MNIDEKILSAQAREKIKALGHRQVEAIIDHYASLCQPDKITVITDSSADQDYVKQLSLTNQEEQKLSIERHTIHFDSYHDQGRDKANTKVLVPEGQTLSRWINTGERSDGLKEIEEKLDGIMQGKEMLVCFFALGPLNSKFTLFALQITDSAYVAHSETMLYRPGYEAFKKSGSSLEFFHFIHSSGELENNVSKNLDQRRIYIDLQENRVFAINTQYAGNSVGLKKLALRLAINKANQEDWLTEHMFIMGVQAPGKNRISYFTGAFPSGCGKTSTAMISGQLIIGDDIAFIKPGSDGRAYAANVEQGIFGIIEGVNQKNDPLIYEALTTPREVVFSNVLVAGGQPFWQDTPGAPEKGVNHSGEWHKGKKDSADNIIPLAHKNARYTIRIKELSNADPNLENPAGVPVSGFIYGGRDSDTSPPVLESLSWSHGVFVGAILESETTAMTLDKAGVRKHNPMSNLDFLVIPLSTYIENHLAFGKNLDNPPKIFATNYFLKENGEFLNGMLDKKVWLMWMEGRAHNEFGALETPVGLIPKYEDLQKLFREVLETDYAKEDYEKQFSIKIDKLSERLTRVTEIYNDEPNLPDVFKDHLTQQKTRLAESRQKFGTDTVSPLSFY